MENTQEKTINPKTYTLDEALEYTGIKQRTFENLKLAYTKEKRTAKDGKERDVRVYSQSVLDEAKEARNRKVHVPGAAPSALEVPPTGAIGLQELQAFAGYLLEGVQKQNLLAAAPEEKPAKRKIDFADFKDKLILNFNEARHLSGLTSIELKQALDDKKIKAVFHETGARTFKGKTVQTGRWRIQRASLEEFIQDYFN